MMWLGFLALVLLLGVDGVTGEAGGGGGSGDMQVVAARQLAKLLAGANLTSARATAATLATDGSWPDINYSDTTRTGGWQPGIHLVRLQAMVGALRAYNDSSLAQPSHAAVKYWLERDPRSLNWYWNELAVPAKVSSVALLFQPWLQPTELAGLVRVMWRATWWDGRTGDNLDSEVTTQIVRGCIESNFSVVEAGFARLWQEVKVTEPTAGPSPPHATGSPTDGIQADRSFHQHGPELLAGSYGEGYVEATLSSIVLARGTVFAPPDATVELFVELLLDGMRWMTFRKNGNVSLYWDISVKGRDIGTHPRAVSFSPAQLLAIPNSERKTELAAFAAALCNHPGQSGCVAVPPPPPGGVSVLGHRAYWCSDYAVAHGCSPFTGARWFTSVHMHSNRTVSARCVNGQGGDDEHTGDAMQYLYYTGEEYGGIFKVWNWVQMPGTTARLGNSVQHCNYSAQLAADSSTFSRE
jgi:chondroitin AC lyase